jgi:adenylate kinase family enzyme
MANRIHIIGGPGSGKSTLASRLAAEHGIPHVELDALFWNDADGGYDVRRDPEERDLLSSVER